MPEIQGFRGLRYDLGHVGSLSDVVAPPYDVIDSALQDSLYKLHPANVVRLILNRQEPGDTEAARYERAARFLRNWRREGVLQQESQNSLYVYHQLFDYAGTTYCRKGFMGRMRLQPFGQGNIYPHEQTHASAKADRLLLTNHCRANLSQIFGIYPDAENQAQAILEDAIAGVAPLEATDHLGVVHRIWPVSDVQAISAVAGVMGPKPMYVADGHHRYETACNYRDQLAAEGPLASDHPANFVLTMCVSMDDPGMIVLPTHRLFRGLPELSCQDLEARLTPYFSLQEAGTGPRAAEALWEQIEFEGDQAQLGLYSRRDDRWLRARLEEAGRSKLDEVAAEASPEWRSLGVSILHRLLVETLLEAGDLPKPKYVHLVDELIDGLGDPQESFNLAVLVMPATLEHIRAVSEHGERMPAKSTYFYPKLLSGLVINPLDG